jgi:hypothetical protein
VALPRQARPPDQPLMGRERRDRDVLVRDGQDRKEGPYSCFSNVIKDEPKIDAEEALDDAGRLPD